jgi:hypothetical protein
MGSLPPGWYLMPRLSLDPLKDCSSTPKYLSASCREGKNPSLEKLLSL